MLLDAVSKIKRHSILVAILLMSLSIVLLLCPEKYIPALIMAAGYGMIIYSLEQGLEFLVKKSSLMSSITFVIAIFVGLIGIAVLIYQEDVLSVLSWVFGLLLILEGGNSIYYAFTFARRSGRKGWSILVIVASLLIAAGLVLILGVIFFSFAAFKTPLFLMRMIGVAVMFSAVFSLIRLLWIWPVKKGGDENVE